MLFYKNSDGYVNTNKLGTLVFAINLNFTESFFKELKKKIDSSNSGQWNLPQIENLVRVRDPDPDTLQKVIDTLKVFDSDHDGKISVEELVFEMVNIGERMSEAEVREIIADSKLDGGNAIKVEEFAKIIMNRIWFWFEIV